MMLKYFKTPSRVPTTFRFVYLFWGLRPSQSNGVMSSMVSLPNHTFTGFLLEAVNLYCTHSFARNWQLTFLNQRKGVNDRKKYFVIGKEKKSKSHFPWLGSNPVRRIQSPALYHVAIKAGFYRKAVEVYHIPNCYIFMINLHKRMLPTRQMSNLQPADHQSDVHPTEPLRPDYFLKISTGNFLFFLNFYTPNI